MVDEVTTKKEQTKPVKKAAAKITKKPANKPKGKAGAKGKYIEWVTPEGLLKIGGWAKDGLIDSEIASNIGISPKTLIEWKKRFPELCNALKETKEIADRTVENAHYKSATGYTVKIKKVFKVRHVKYKDGKRVSEDEELIEKEEEMHVPANVQAQISWLCNRKPGDWKNIRIIGLTGGKGDGGPVEMTVDWAEEIKRANERIAQRQAQEP